MFDGEYASLCAIYNTQTVSVPRPIKVLQGVVSHSCLPAKHVTANQEIKVLDR